MNWLLFLKIMCIVSWLGIMALGVVTGSKEYSASAQWIIAAIGAWLCGYAVGFLIKIAAA